MPDYTRLQCSFLLGCKMPKIILSKVHALVQQLQLFCCIVGHSQECQTVTEGERLFILPNSSFCANCPYMNVSFGWRIELTSLDNYVSTSEYTIFPNNSLLMLRSVEGSYQCGSVYPNVYQFDVVFASKYVMCNSILMFTNCCS